MAMENISKANSTKVNGNTIFDTASIEIGIDTQC
jgi:hypothetical protein